jgi:hypothetical protein
MRRLVSTVLAVILLAATVVAIGDRALAYFSTTGSGIAAAAVSKLSAPTITAATPAVGGTVSLSWSSVSAPGSGTVKYYVTRDGGDPAGTCAAPAVPTAATSCKDSSLEVGSHTYTVTAVWRSWNATSATSSAKITIGAATQFTLAAASSTPAAGASNNLTIVAKDENESTVTTYTGSHSLIFSGASASPGGTAPTIANSSGTATAFGKATALSFSAGVASVSSSKNGLMKIYRAGAAEIVASEGSITTALPLDLTVIAETAAKYTLATATTTPGAGTANGLTVTALDAYGNTVTAYTGPHSLVFSGASASVGGNVPTVTDSAGAEIPFGSATAIDFDAGVAVAAGGANGEMTLYKSGAASVKATEGSLTNSIALALTVAAGAAANLALTASTTTPVAAASSNLTTTARDVYGNTVTAYTGSKSLIFSGAEAGPGGTAPTVVNSAGTAVAFSSTTALNFSSGVASVSASKNGLIRLYGAGAVSLAATDGTISTAAPLAVTVSVGTAARWGLTTVEASAGLVSLTCLFTCPVTGLGNGGTVSANVSITDSAGNTVSNVGSGRAAKVTATGGTVSDGASLAIPATGLAVSEARFTYTAPASGSFTNTITAATLNGSSYTNATATASK